MIVALEPNLLFEANFTIGSYVSMKLITALLYRWNEKLVGLLIAFKGKLKTDESQVAKAFLENMLDRYDIYIEANNEFQYEIIYS